MPALVCTRCGQHYPLTDAPPEHCVLCQDERFAAPAIPYAWTSTTAMRQTHFATFRRLEPGLIGIGVAPHFAFGNRALLLRTTQGNILWDCPSFIDEATVTIVTALGGIAAIATSAPTGHGAMVEWSHAFGSAPIYIQATDRKFVTRMDSSVHFWEDEAVELLPGITLYRSGGQFDGGTVLHWAQGSGGGGTILVGDALQVSPDGTVAFMRSRINAIPLAVDTVIRIGDLLGGLVFDGLYGATWDSVIQTGAQNAFARSVRRYLDATGMPTAL